MTGVGWQVIVEIPGKPPVELKPGEVLIGRSRSCALQIPESTVSRQHARLRVGPEGQVVVEDLGSSNGTFVNGERVIGSRALLHGDRLVVGEAELRVSILPPVGAAEATMKVELPPINELELASPPSLPEVPSTPQAPSPPVPLAPPALSPPPAPSLASRPSTPPPVLPPPGGTSPRLVEPASPVAPSAPGAPLSQRSGRMPPSPSATPHPGSAAKVPATVPAPPPPKPSVPATPSGGDLLPSIAEIEKMPLPPAAPARAKTGTHPGVRLGRETLAGFWIRVGAYLIDMALLFGLYLVVALLSLLLGFVLPPAVMFLVSFGLGALLMLAGGLILTLYLPATRGQTPGKRVLGLWIVKEGERPGTPLGWNTALLRLVGHLACAVTAGLGYLLAGFTERKQGLHDLIAKTRVVRLR